jgi:hypothetical protein
LGGKRLSLLLRGGTGDGEPPPGQPARSLRHILCTHNLILSKRNLVPAAKELYNQGNFRFRLEREPMALNLHLKIVGSAQ